jgi:hypothetical protein
LPSKLLKRAMLGPVPSGVFIDWAAERYRGVSAG